MSAESLNICTLSGNLGNDAEVKYTAGGMAITVFSLAVNHRRKQQDGSYADETSWVDCTIFGKRGESLQANGYLQKGAKLAVVGAPAHEHVGSRRPTPPQARGHRWQHYRHDQLQAAATAAGSAAVPGSTAAGIRA